MIEIMDLVDNKTRLLNLEAMQAIAAETSSTTRVTMRDGNVHVVDEPYADFRQRLTFLLNRMLPLEVRFR
jgi:hypothetical protein